MIKKFFFPVLLILLAWVFIVNPTVKDVAAGVAILLFGMMMLEEGFNAFVEGPLQKLLRKATNKLYKSLGLGFLVTALLQSSSLISVITIAFLSAGIIELYAGIGIIFGANLGTTATAWLVAIFGLKLKVSSLAMPMLAFGIIFVLQKVKTLKGIGYVLAGLGFFFLGIHYMKLGFDTYQDSINLAEYAMTGFKGVIVFTGIGILITVVMQSSSAAMALILTALAVNQITYNNSLALAIGANIGTTITAVIGSIGSNTAGKRLAGAHLIFNIFTGLIALIFLNQLSILVELISDGVGLGSEDYVFKLSIFHSIFNFLGVLIMVPFIKPIIRLLKKLFKEKNKDELAMEQPYYLNESILSYPQTALRALVDESKRLLEGAIFEIIAHGLNLHRDDIQSSVKLKKLVANSKEHIEIDIDEMYLQRIKLIYSQIVKYATLAQSNFSLEPEDMVSFTRIKVANRKMVEAVKATKGLNANVNKYINSENQYIVKEYDKLRQKVSKVLRAVHATSVSSEPESMLMKLEKLKAKARKSDILTDGSLDELLGNQKIRSVMATSLVTDSDKVAKISHNLLEAAELLYINADPIVLNEPPSNGNEL